MLFNNDCSIYNSNGNSVSYNFQGTAGVYIGFDLNLSYIDSISERPCNDFYIENAVILNDRSYYTTRGGGALQCSSIVYDWVPSDLPQNELNSWDTCF